MKELVKLIEDNKTYLIRRVLKYAKKHDYTKYTSTLEEAWTASITGLSSAMTLALAHDPGLPEIPADHDFKRDPIAAFGVLEAYKHRQRGITLEMFLSLMKYYRQGYLDLVDKNVADPFRKRKFSVWIIRFFDINEIAFCSEWDQKSSGQLLGELQLANRSLANEKNKYLTIYESIPTPALIFDVSHRCTNMNYAAQQLLNGKANTPGYMYYSGFSEYPEIGSLLPWLKDEYDSFCSGNAAEVEFETVFNAPLLGERNLLVKFQRMLDVSNKFEGSVVLLGDLTAYKQIEQQLRVLSFYDQLTGLYNRTYMNEEIQRFSSGRHDPMAVISVDVDGLKLVNDHLGHGAGDALLVEVGRMLQSNFREDDIVVRVGGDEFIALIPNCSRDTADKLCSALRNKVEQYNMQKADFPISISIGSAVGGRTSGTWINELIKEADRNMYEDKKQNRESFEKLFWASQQRTEMA